LKATIASTLAGAAIVRRSFAFAPRLENEAIKIQLESRVSPLYSGAEGAIGDLVWRRVQGYKLVFG
jgi:hypothetical protein